MWRRKNCKSRGKKREKKRKERKAEDEGKVVVVVAVTIFPGHKFLSLFLLIS